MQKSIVIIAVSKYSGGYPNLPGVIASAYAVADWATGPGQEYRALVIMDEAPNANISDDEVNFELDICPNITIDLLKRKIGSFLEADTIDRLVVYFAGHGLVRSAAEQFWLLSNAASDRSEGVDVQGFKLGLEHFNIGEFNRDLSRGQICLIADACRNIGQQSIGFRGDPILTKTTGRKPCRFDLFFSTTLGEFSFQANATQREEAFCIFTSVLLEGLKGVDRRAIETDHHKFKPVVTSQRLSEFLEEEVPKRAEKYGVTMNPDPIAGFHDPFNDYKRIDPSIPIEPAERPETETRTSLSDLSRTGLSRPNTSYLYVNNRGSMAMTPSTRDRFGDQKGKQTEEREKRHRTLLKAKDTVVDALNAFPNLASAVLGANLKRRFKFAYTERPERICAPRGFKFQTNSNLNGQPVGLLIEDDASKPVDANVFAKYADQWISVPNYASTLSVYFHDFPGDIFLYEVEGGLWDHVFSDIVSLDTQRPLRLKDSVAYADYSRRLKHKLPHKSVIAGYLYEFANDHDNILRTAHYMARSGLGDDKPYLPIDVALLCADRVEWREVGSRVVAFADLPSVEAETKIAPHMSRSSRPTYTTTAFSSLSHIPCVGEVPTFRQGWKYMEYARFQVPSRIAKVADYVKGRTVTTLTEEGMSELSKVLEYTFYEIPSSSDSTEVPSNTVSP